MAQTTRNTLFGPVLIVFAHLNPRRSIKSYIEPKYY